MASRATGAQTLAKLRISVSPLTMLAIVDGAVMLSAHANRKLANENPAIILLEYLKRNGVSTLLQLLHSDSRRLAERLEVIEFTFLLAVFDDHLGLLLRQTHHFRDLAGRGHVHIDPTIPPDQVGHDGGKFLLGPLSPQ